MADSNIQNILDIIDASSKETGNYKQAVRAVKSNPLLRYLKEADKKRNQQQKKRVAKMKASK